jgi:hypothetical protein
MWSRNSMRELLVGIKNYSNLKSRPVSISLGAAIGLAAKRHKILKIRE